MKISKRLAKGMMAVGVTGILGSSAYCAVVSSRIEREAYRAGVYRVEEIAAEQESMLPTLGSCYIESLVNSSSSSACTNAGAQYMQLQAERNQLENTPTYQEALARKATAYDEQGVTIVATLIGSMVLTCVGLNAYLRQKFEKE